MAPVPELVIVELRDQLREVAKLRLAIEALTSILSDNRDELIRARQTNEETNAGLRELVAHLRAQRAA